MVFISPYARTEEQTQKYLLKQVHKESSSGQSETFT